MNKIILGILVLIVALGVYANFAQKSTEQKNEAAKMEKELVNKNNKENNMTQVLLETNQGDITLELFSEDAPNTVANFVKLAGEGFYDGTRFHRVIKGFMIQGGDPLSRDEEERNMWGTGGPGYKFEDEIHANNLNAIGTISMANSGPNTNGSQFFINTADNNFLDPKHTVFGKVVAGMETVSAIENTETAEADRPVEDMIIESIQIVEN